VALRSATKKQVRGATEALAKELGMAIPKI
jgi:hypothetical protein